MGMKRRITRRPRVTPTGWIVIESPAAEYRRKYYAKKRKKILALRKKNAGE